MTDLSVRIGSLSLRSPLVIASGTWGYDETLWREDLVKNVGAICSKAITDLPKEGNPGIRIWETPCGLLNSIGLQNTGIDDFVEKKVPSLKKRGVPVIANVSMEDEKGLLRMMDRILEVEDDISAIELNVSCPNVDQGCMSWGVSPDLTAQAVKMVRDRWNRPLWVKLTPQAPDVAEVAKAAEGAGADALVVANTWLGMAMDVYKRKPVFERVVAGMSGPAVFPMALRLVWQVSGAVSVPVIGCGGATDGEDVLAMMMAGATAVEMGTAFFRDIRAADHVVEFIEEYMERENIDSLSSLIGCARG